MRFSESRSRAWQANERRSLACEANYVMNAETRVRSLSAGYADRENPGARTLILMTCVASGCGPYSNYEHRTCQN